MSSKVICFLLLNNRKVIQWAKQFHKDIIIALDEFCLIFTPDNRTLPFICYYTEYQVQNHNHFIPFDFS